MSSTFNFYKHYASTNGTPSILDAVNNGATVHLDEAEPVIMSNGKAFMPKPKPVTARDIARSKARIYRQLARLTEQRADRERAHTKAERAAARAFADLQKLDDRLECLRLTLLNLDTYEV